MNAKTKKKSALLGLSTLFIVSIGILLLGVNGVIGNLALTGGNVVFGNSVVGDFTDANDANAQSITYFTSNSAGSVTDIAAYISVASQGNVMAALYGDDGSLIMQSNSVSVGSSFSWVDFSLPYAYSAEVGHTYGLALLGDVSVNVAVVTGEGHRINGPGSGSFNSGFSDPFGTVYTDDSTGGMSIYASGSSSVPPTSSPTVSPTAPPNSAAVTVNTGGGGSVMASWATGSNEVSSTFYVPIGTYVQFADTPFQGFQLDHWVVNGAGAGNTQVLGPIQINSATTVDAVFLQISPTPSPTPAPIDGTTSGSLAILGGGMSAVSGLGLGLVGFGKVKP